mmetsp:Transcript_26462/g.43670  ORF Transcript_26462/g.43670 Transcript_26462/m.43670 type:complete len:224 (-) Transcript_26462:27-698(-)
MSMGKKGQAKVQAVITSRLDGKNIDRVARAKSSNRCENMFHVLAKYSHGKRLNQSRTDTWKVNGLYVAATINNNKHAIENKIRERTGVKTSPTLREEACRKHYKRKEYHKEMSQSEKVIQQRKKRKIASTSKAVKNMNAPARHKPDKLSPKDDCKSNKENKAVANKAAAKKRKRKCKNCDTFHNGPCEEPSYADDSAKSKENNKKKTNGYTKEEWEEMFMMYT